MTQAARPSSRAAALLSGWTLCLLATFMPLAAHAAPPGQREVAPGDFAPTSVPMVLQGAGPATLSLFSSKGLTQQPDIAPPGTCTFTALPNDNSTSGNERCPMLRNRFGRSVYLITASELAANGLVSGSSILGIGWNYQTAQGLSGSGPLVVYLQNTSDATNLKSTTWATAITGMTVVHNATTTLPSPAGTFDISFSGGSPFTYTGGGLYVAFDMQYPTGTLSTTTVAWCNSLGLVNGLLGAQGTTAPTTLAASSFRPETRFTATVPANDAAVSLLVSLGQVPLGLGGPQAIQAIIVNKGNSTLTNLPVTLGISGAESFTDTQIIPSLSSCGTATTVTFAPFTPTSLGSDVVTVSVPSDDNSANNSQSKTLTVTMPTESYKYVGTTSSGGVGLTGASGAFVCKFNTVAATNVTQVIPEFAATSATTYKIAIFKDSGVGTPGSQLYVDAANRTVSAAGPVTITLPAPVAVGPGTFFVGIEQTNTTNASLAFDTEAPVRTGAFFLATALPPATWTDFAPGNNFKPNIGITLDRCNIAPTVGNNGPLCAGGTLQLTASAAGAASYSWTGPNGFSSSQQNPSIPGVSALEAGAYTCTVNGCATGGSAVTNVVVNTGPYTITASAAAGGTMSPGSVSVACGGSQTYTITPGPCSAISDVNVDGVSQGAIASYTFSNVTANHTISATFSLLSYTITSSSGPNGTLLPLGSTPVSCGSSQAYTITPAAGYQVADVLVDGVSQGAIGSYTFSSVGANHTIAASFSLATAVVSGASPSATICPTTPCVTVPVSLARTSSTGVLAFSVTFQLSGDLALCSGTGSVTEGTFLSGVGPTLFNVVSLGGNSYRADGALTANCGATATSGLLFNVGVTSASAGGTGSVTVTAVSLRDCSNHALPAGAGSPAAVPYDNQPPVVTVTSPNGGEVLAIGASFPITWTASDNTGVANVDIAYSTDGGASYPNVIATGVANTGSYAWTVPNTPTATARVRVTAHDAGCSSSADASDNNFAIGNVVAAAAPPGCLTPAHTCVTVPVNIARADATNLRLFHVVFTLSPNLQLCGPAGTSILEGTYLSNVNPSTTFFVVSNGGGQYTVDGTINGTPCGATAATGNLFEIHVAANGGSGAGTVTLNSVTLRDCFNVGIPGSPGAPANVTIDTAPVTVAAIPSPQFVQETSTLTITPSATLTACATGPVTWSVAPALPAGASLSTSTGVISWTPPCGSVGSYGPFTLTAMAASGDAGSSNAFTIQVTHHAGTVSVSNIPSPQTVTETTALTTPTPVATLGACASGPVTWSVSPALPSGASFSTSTGVITWTPPCGSAGSFGPFTLTATAATGESGSGNAFTIQVDHKTGTVTVAAISTPQTVAELSTLTITPAPTLTSCAAAPLTWTVAPPLPSGASLNTSTGVITWTPDCLAAQGGSSGDYGPFTLTATAATGETGSSNAFTIHVTDTPTSVGPATSVSATQVLTGNPAGDKTQITLHFTAASGTVTSKVYRAPFGHYPYYDDAGGAVPPAPGAYPPPAPWVLTAVTSDGGQDLPPVRDFWYYVVYDVNACGDVSTPSTMTTGTLDYHLGDVSDGITHGQGDNLVQTSDISELGAHYGISLAPSDPLGYLDVGPTTTGYVDGRPLTDQQVDFEDLILYAINYAHVSSPATRPASIVAGGDPKSITTDELIVSSPDHVSMGEVLGASLVMRGTGAVQGLSIHLSWNPDVVVPTGFKTGQFLSDLDGAALSVKAGSVDAVVLGSGRGVAGEGELANVTFRVIAAGDPQISIRSVDARDTHNQSIHVATSREAQSPLVPTITAMQSVTPNPFRGSVALGFALAKAGRVQFDIYSVDGRRVKTVTSGAFDAGEYSFSWDGRDEGGNAMAAGVYYARFVAGSLKFSRTLTLLK